MIRAAEPYFSFSVFFSAARWITGNRRLASPKMNGGKEMDYIWKLINRWPKILLLFNKE